jgi:hypothetical protein
VPRSEATGDRRSARPLILISCAETSVPRIRPIYMDPFGSAGACRGPLAVPLSAPSRRRPGSPPRTGRPGERDREELPVESRFHEEMRRSPWIERRLRPYRAVCVVVAAAHRVNRCPRPGAGGSACDAARVAAGRRWARSLDSAPLARGVAEPCCSVSPVVFVSTTGPRRPTGPPLACDAVAPRLLEPGNRRRRRTESSPGRGQ